MADDENLDITFPVVGESWGTINFTLPDALEGVRKGVNNVAQTLHFVLDIAVGFLQLVKAFAFGILDPLMAIVEGILDLIMQMIDDLKNVGLYLTSDEDLLTHENQYIDIRGGYAEFERRIIAKLLDTSDPTRPVVSENTHAFTFIGYASADFSQIQRVIKLVKKLMALFNGRPDTDTLPTPVINSIKYLPEFSSLTNWVEDDAAPAPKRAKVDFSIPGVRIPVLSGYSNFVVTVSSIPDGIQLYYKDKPLPFRLYGGADMIHAESLDPKIAEDIYGLVDGNAHKIKLSDILKGFFQSTFYVETFPSVQLSFDKMPNHALITADGLVNEGVASIYYVRVATRGEDKKIKYDLTKITDSGLPISEVPTIEGRQISSWSPPEAINFPSAYTKQFIQALRTSLAVLALSRPDMEIIEKPDSSLYYESGALQRTGLEEMRNLYDRIYADLEFSEDPVRFRRVLLTRIKRVADDIYEAMGQNTPLEKLVAERTVELRTATWGSLIGPNPSIPTKLAENTILGGLSNTEVYSGIAHRPTEAGLSIEDFQRLKRPFPKPAPHFHVTEDTDGFSVREEMSSFELEKSPYRHIYEPYYKPETFTAKLPFEVFEYLKFLTSLPGSTVNGAAESPCIRTIGDEFLLLRNVLDNTFVYSQASFVLGLASKAVRPGTGAWTAVRFFDMLPGLYGFTKALKEWLAALKDTLKGFVDELLKYIDFLIDSIREIQQMIRKINALIQAVLGSIPKLPEFWGFLSASRGTAGLVQDILTAKNKPFDSIEAYGAGIMFVMPVVPGSAFAYDFIKMLIQKDEDRAPDENAEAVLSIGTPAFTIDAIEAEGAEEDDEEPDVL